MASDSAISHAGMPNGIRAIITIGEVKGISDVQNASCDPGALAACIAMIMPMMMG